MHRLDHVALRVADLDRAITFYRDKIGLSLMFSEVDPEHHEAFAFLELEGGNLELLQLLDDGNQPLPFTQPAPAPPWCPHVALGVADLDALMGTLAENGLALLKGPLEIPGKVRWLYLADPDNNVLEFVQWLRD
jgi:catechol 2,3-dioxygenase-like lactoylglutathione lyase family enzyme